MKTIEQGKAKCYCHTCGAEYHTLGIASHRAMHRRKNEDCTITFTSGNTFTWRYSKKKPDTETKYFGAAQFQKFFIEGRTTPHPSNESNYPKSFLYDVI